MVRSLIHPSFVAVLVFGCMLDFSDGWAAVRDVHSPPPSAQHHEKAPVQPPAPRAPRRVAPPVEVSRNGFTSIQVNVDEFGNNILGDAANEPSIVIDPTNPNRVAIGWRQFDSVASNFRQAGYAWSRDAGRTWTFPGVLDPGVFRSDPVLDSDADGVFYYYSLTDPAFEYCDLFKSTDAGVSWTGPVFAEGGDKAWITIDRTAGVGRGNIYAKWGNQFTRSTDGGLTFEPPVTTPEPGGWGTAAVGPDGVLYGAGGNFLNPVKYVKSTTAQDPNQPLDGSFTGDKVPLGGRPWGFKRPNVDGGLGQAWIAVNPASGPQHGHIYVLCSVHPSAGDPLDVRFSRSEDGGDTWSESVRVNDDPIGTNAYQWFGTMSVAPNGRIDVIWNDTRNDPTPSNATYSELYYSYSIDEGETWSANIPISPPFNHFLGYPNQSKLGDYYQTISDGVGVNVAYAATFNGEQDIWFPRIGDFDCNGNGIGDSDDLAEGTAVDFNDNGVPDECDCLGDLNHDWTVDLADLATLLSSYGATGGASYEDGDLDEDGDVDLGDLAALLSRYDLSCP